ncbi:cytochrome c maturation protein CcmE [Chitinibacteraceae bacterium HSL-7]
MKARQKRFALLAGALVVLALIAYFVVSAFRENLVFFYSPTQVLSGEAPKGRAFRIGGMVEMNSIRRDGVTAYFRVTDTDRTLPVRYEGVLPDLFQEGKGVVAQGSWDGHKFTATEVLAKHDENYMPPEAAQAVADAHARAAAKKAQAQ